METDMRKIIEGFHQQFLFEPVIENEAAWRINKRDALYNLAEFTVFGMGGSHLAADIVKYRFPDMHIDIRKDYGLPNIYKTSFLAWPKIFVSHSGNTEEITDTLDEALCRAGRMSPLPHLGVISCGGKLLKTAKNHALPYIQIPDTGIPPRSATAYMTKALLKMMRRDETYTESAYAELTNLARSLHPEEFETAGKELAERMRGKVPIIYASSRNEVIAQNWKIRLNESGKIPAFYNVFPELNHNEMNGFIGNGKAGDLATPFAFFFLEDETDHPRIRKRMAILKELYQNNGLTVESVKLESGTPFYKLLASIILADWTSYYTALQYSVEPLPVPTVEEFKKAIVN